MPTAVSLRQEVVKIQPRGLITIPKAMRQGGFEENSLIRLVREKGRLILEPLTTLPYSVRRYTSGEVDEFLVIDKQDTRALKKKRLL